MGGSNRLSTVYVQANCAFFLLCAPCCTSCSLLSWIIKSTETIHAPLVLLEPQVVCKFAAVKKKNPILTFWIPTFFSLILRINLHFLNYVQLLNKRYEICCSGAVRGAWWEDSGDVRLRLRQIFKARCHRRGEDSHEHHRSWAADRGVAGPGECRSRGGAASMLISILYILFHIFRHIFPFWFNIYKICKDLTSPLQQGSFLR